jgi:hypothetical protein
VIATDFHGEEAAMLVFQAAIAMSAESRIQTGPKTQFGGAMDGRTSVLYQPRTSLPVHDALVPATVKQTRSPDIKVIQRISFPPHAMPDGRIIGLMPLLMVWALSAKVLSQLIGAV